jgi:hypothetical protein
MVVVISQSPGFIMSAAGANDGNDINIPHNKPIQTIVRMTVTISCPKVGELAFVLYQKITALLCQHIVVVAGR